MKIDLFKHAFQQVFFPEISIVEKENSESDESVHLNDHILSFNGFLSQRNYTDYIWTLIESIEKEIKQNLKSASSRIKALYYIKQLKLDIKKFSRSFTVIIENRLNEYEQAFYDYLKNSNKNLPEELLNIKEYKLTVNRNIVYSEELKELCTDLSDQKIINRFESAFVSVQKTMVEELEMMIETFESFVENVSVEDFNNKDEFFEIDFSTVTLSDSVKLTDKKVNMKIDTLDIRQSALLFDYLEKAKLILPYNNKDKAYFTHYLTGHAQEKLRTEKGFGMIEAIRKDKEKPKKFEDVRFYNLKTVRNELNRLVRLINKDIDRFSEK
jgi:hypothetical protein